MWCFSSVEYVLCALTRSWMISRVPVCQGRRSVFTRFVKKVFVIPSATVFYSMVNSLFFKLLIISGRECRDKLYISAKCRAGFISGTPRMRNEEWVNFSRKLCCESQYAHVSRITWVCIYICLCVYWKKNSETKPVSVQLSIYARG